MYFNVYVCGQQERKIFFEMCDSSRHEQNAFCCLGKSRFNAAIPFDGIDVVGALVSVCIEGAAVVRKQCVGVPSPRVPNLTLAVSRRCYGYCLRSATT